MECFWNCVFLSELENLQGNRTENNKKKHLLPHVHSISISRFSVNNPLSSPVYPFFLLSTALNLIKQKLILKLYYDAIYYIYTYTYTIPWTYLTSKTTNKTKQCPLPVQLPGWYLVKFARRVHMSFCSKHRLPKVRPSEPQTCSSYDGQFSSQMQSNLLGV